MNRKTLMKIWAIFSVLIICMVLLGIASIVGERERTHIIAAKLIEVGINENCKRTSWWSAPPQTYVVFENNTTTYTARTPCKYYDFFVQHLGDWFNISVTGYGRVVWIYYEEMEIPAQVNLTQ